MNLLLRSVLIFPIVLNSVQLLPEALGKTYDVLYADGINAYAQERWFECMSLMQQALKDFHFHQENLANCRLRCQNKPKSEADPRQHLELAFFESILLRSSCLRRCKQRFLGDRAERPVSRDVNEAFTALLPYDYLQICAYKV